MPAPPEGAAAVPDAGGHRRRLGGRVGWLRRDDRGDDGAVGIAVEQAAVLIAHHVVAAGEQRGESRIRGDAGVDEPDRHPRAGGVLPRLGDVQHDVARRGLGDVRDRHGQRVGAGVLLLHLLVGTGRIVRRQRARGRHRAARWPPPPRASSRWRRAAGQPLPPQMRSALRGSSRSISDSGCIAGCRAPMRRTEPPRPTGCIRCIRRSCASAGRTPVAAPRSRPPGQAPRCRAPRPRR